MAKAPSRSEESLEKRAEAAIQESRMVLPGIQTLFGFQLIAGFNQGFRRAGGRLSSTCITSSLILTALAIAIIMTPAAYHRIVEQGSVSLFFVRLISWLICTAMVPLAVALGLEVYVVGTVILGDRALSAVIAGGWSRFSPTLWFVFPFVMRCRKLP